MEQTLHLPDISVAPSRKVKILRSLALTLIFIMLFPFWGIILNSYYYTDVSFFRSIPFIIFQVVFSLLWFGVYVILAFLSSNRQVRLAVIANAAFRFIALTCNVVSFVLADDFWVTLDVGGSIIYILFYLSIFYYISVVLSNNRCGNNAWIALLCILVPVNFVQLCGLTQYFYFALGSNAWNILTSVLCAVGYYHMVRSNVFAGPVETEDKQPLFSFDRNFWIGITVSVIACLLFWSYSEFITPLLSNLNS